MPSTYWCPRCPARTHELSEGERIGYMCLVTGLDFGAPIEEEDPIPSVNGREMHT